MTAAIVPLRTVAARTTVSRPADAATPVEANRPVVLRGCVRALIDLAAARCLALAIRGLPPVKPFRPPSCNGQPGVCQAPDV